MTAAFGLLLQFIFIVNWTLVVKVGGGSFPAKTVASSPFVAFDSSFGSPIPSISSSLVSPFPDIEFVLEDILLVVLTELVAVVLCAEVFERVGFVVC